MKQGWEIKKLGEVCEINLGKTPPRSDARMWDKERQSKNIWLSIADLNSAEGGYVNDSKEYISDEAKQNIKIVKKGTLLLSFKLTLGKTAFAGTDLYTNEAIAALPFKDKSLNKFFLKYYFESFDWQKFASGDEKVLGKTLNKKKLDIIPIPVPSLLEQGRIVEVLDAAFAKIDALKENAQKNLENAKALFQQVLKQELTPKPNWQTKKLGEVCVIVGGSTPKTNIKEYWENGVYNWITPADLKGEKYQGETHRKLSEIALQRNSLKILPIGSVLLSSRAPIGKVAITTVPMFTNQGFKSAICSEEINNEFLYWFLYANTDYLNSLGTGATFKEISKRTTENIKISLPPLVEQIKVVKILNAVFKRIDVLIANAEKTIAECDALKQAVLHRAFNGEL